MSKRKRDMEETTLKKKSCTKNNTIRLLKTPPINSINDLIEIGQGIKYYRNLDTITLWKITPHLEELNNLVGMTELKESLFYQILYYIQGMHLRNHTEEYLHTILLGPPGTGKTTVALIIAKIYQGLGILSNNGPFKIAHREDFIAGYLGQTALKTQKLLESCLGGVLFIDEVYSLGSGQKDKDSFSKEAIDTLCSFLSEHTNDFCCIAAGYEKDIINCFFSVNSGLESRFQWKHKIGKYSVSELSEIFLRKVKTINWDINVKKEDVMEIIKNEEDMFINVGRDVVNFISKCKVVHAHRVISLGKEHKFILTLTDLRNGMKIMKKTKIVKKITKPPYGLYI